MSAMLWNMSLNERDVAVIRKVWRTQLGMTGHPIVQRLGGRSHRVYECAAPDGAAWIMRLADPDRSRFAVEARVIEHCAGKGIPVPEIAYTGSEVAADGEVVALMAQAKAKGLTITKLAEKEGPELAHRLVRQAGELLAAIHDIATSGYGLIDGDLSGPASTFSDWFIDGLAHKIEAALRIAQDPRPLIEQASNLLAAHRTILDTCTPSLAHGDYSPDNILSDGKTITAVIDWESAKSGPPGQDIGWWDCFFDSELHPTRSLVAGYRQVRPLDEPFTTAMRHLCVLRVMIGHFSWTMSVNDHAGIALAVERLQKEVASSADWRLSS
jgi:aminoglycoside phosphotransferase (APT) family kinase protein